MQKLAVFGIDFAANRQHDVRKLRYDGSKVWINDEQHFCGVSGELWDMPIGGYKPAQKWLKDRIGRRLTYSEIDHYQKVLAALQTTSELLDEIDQEYKQLQN